MDRNIKNSITFFLLFFICVYGNSQIKNSEFQKFDSYILHFNSNKWHLSNCQKEKIDSILSIYTNKQIKFVQVIGHTDDIGDSIYNIGLSKKRSKTVAEYIKLNQPDYVLKISYFGENEPVKPNINSNSRALNRRVELIINRAEKDEQRIKSLAELYKLIAPPPQEFCINNNSDTVIVGEEGTFIYIKANTFKHLNNSQCIKISLKERYKKSDIVRDNLTTLTTDNKIIVSQAMFEIASNQKPISDYGIITFTPTDTIIPELLSFIGIRNDENLMNWKQNNNDVTNISGKEINSFLNKICFSETIVYDTLDSRCPLFFCKILNGLKIRKYEPLVNYTIIKDTMPCLLTPALEQVLYISDTISLVKLKNIPSDSLKYYVFNTSRLGWYNLDWLLNYKEFANYKVYFKPQENLELKLIFKKYRSVIPLIAAEDYYYFPNAPLNTEAWLLALKVDNRKIFMAVKDVIINNKGIHDLNLDKVSIEELYEKMKIFDEVLK